MKKISLIIISLLSAAVLTACGGSKPEVTPTPGVTISPTPGATADTNETAGDKMGNAVEDAGNAVGDTVKDAGDAVGNAVEGVTDSAGNAMHGNK